MILRISVFTLVILFGLPVLAEKRDPLKQPFSPRSIWNMPIGSNADYLPANIQPASRIWPDEDIIILTSKAPRIEIHEHTAGWDRTKNRCAIITDRVFRSLPIPSNFFTADYTGLTPNHACAILSSDGRTLFQNQPFHRCDGNGSMQLLNTNIR